MDADTLWPLAGRKAVYRCFTAAPLKSKPLPIDMSTAAESLIISIFPLDNLDRTI